MIASNCENIIAKTGWGLYHYFIVGLCGVCSFAEACVLPFILVVVQLVTCDLSLRTSHASTSFAVLTLGMAIGAFVFGAMIDANGRKTSIPITMIIVFCATISLSFAQTIFLINLSMFVLGLGLSGNNVVLRVYLIELLPMKQRGTCLVILDILGILGYISALGLSWLLVPSIIQLQNKKFRPNSWRVLISLGGIPNLVMGCATSLLPASPRYLLYRRQYEEALLVLQQMYAINNTKHADTYSLTSLDNCVLPDELDNDDAIGIIKEIWKFVVKVCARIHKIYGMPFKYTTLLVMCISLLQYPGIIWIAAWNIQLRDQSQTFELPKHNSSCTIIVQNMTMGFFHGCDEVNDDRFSAFLYLFISYTLGELLLLVGINTVGRKIFLVSSGLFGGMACLTFLFANPNTIQNILSSVVLAAYAIGGTTASILLLENYFTGARGTMMGLSRMFPYLLGSITKLILNVHCYPSIFIMSGIFISAAIVGSRIPDLTKLPMRE